MSETAILRRRPASGIYIITRHKTGEVYVGSSRNIKARINSHFSSLRRGDHHCSKLQNAFRKYGEVEFDWEILECGGVYSNIFETEQDYITFYAEAGLLYNGRLDATYTGARNPSAATIALRSAKLRGLKRTPEQCARLSAARKEAGISPEHQAVLNEISRARAFRLSDAQAEEVVRRHNVGESWAKISRFMGIPGQHALRRELRARGIATECVVWAWDRGSRPGRSAPRQGASHPKAKFTDADVIEIRISREMHKVLAVRYGVSKATIADIKYGRSWKHLL